MRGRYIGCQVITPAAAARVIPRTFELGNERNLETIVDAAEARALDYLFPTIGCMTDHRVGHFFGDVAAALHESSFYPTEFQIITQNLWRIKPKIERDIEPCGCEVFNAFEGKCSSVDTCLNVASCVLCDPTTCSRSCRNKPFQLRSTVHTRIFKTTNCGAGLITLQQVKSGDFVIEYVGEVIDERIMLRRLRDSAKRKDSDFYIMELSPGIYLDGRHMGNESRFINSSCMPNCETRRWLDSATGKLRIGIFASHDISVGEELTYDYNFQSQSETTKCMCGNHNCRGTL